MAPGAPSCPPQALLCHLSTKLGKLLLVGPQPCRAQAPGTEALLLCHPKALGPLGTLETWQCFMGSCSSSFLQQLLFHLGHATAPASVDPTPTPRATGEVVVLSPHPLHLTPPLPTQTPRSSHAHPSPAHTYSPSLHPSFLCAYVHTHVPAPGLSGSSPLFTFGIP